MSGALGAEPDPQIPTYTWTELPGFERYLSPSPQIAAALERGALRLLNDDEVTALLASGGLPEDERLNITDLPDSTELFYNSNFCAGIDGRRGTLSEHRIWQPWAQRLAILYSAAPPYSQLYRWAEAGFQISSNRQLSGIVDAAYLLARQLVSRNDRGALLSDGSVNQRVLYG